MAKRFTFPPFCLSVVTKNGGMGKTEEDFVRKSVRVAIENYRLQRLTENEDLAFIQGYVCSACDFLEQDFKGYLFDEVDKIFRETEQKKEEKEL